MENKNTVVALVLMAVVWFGFSFLFPQKQDAVNPSVKTDSPAPAVEQQPAQPTPAVSPTSEVAPIIPTSSKIDLSDARDIEVVTDLYHAVLTTSGARLKSFSLNKYKVTPTADSPQVHLTDAHGYAETTLQTGGRDGWSVPVDAIYQVDYSGSKLELTGDQSRTLVFSWQTDSGLQIQKSFQFTGNSYTTDMQVKAVNHDSRPLQGSLSFNLVQPWTEDMHSSRIGFVGPSTLVNDKLKDDSVKDLAKEIKVYQDPAWTSFTTKYFISALIPMQTAGNKVTISRQGDLIVNSLETSYQSLAPGQSATFDFITYFGPRDLDLVKQVGHQFDKAIDYGWFAVIALPLRSVLNFFYGIVGNYGVAIILLTVIIKLLFWPLTQKSYTSMKSMQKLQPEMQKLREKYKNDKERLNKEMMQMYKEKRVNPLGGCLPMIVQIPVFFALYKTLMIDIALRQAPFAFWLTDLSEKDPYYITPVIMGVTMFLQQKMTPSSMDPKQAKLFMLMPVVFTFMFLNFPSGLVIYWLVNNVLTIFQQYLIHRKPA